MGIRGGAQLRHAQNAAQPHLGAPYFAVFFFLYILSGPNYPEGLSGNTLDEHRMQQPGREQATSNVQVVSITSLIRVLLTILQLAPGGEYGRYSHLLITALFVSFCFRSSPFLMNNI